MPFYDCFQLPWKKKIQENENGMEELPVDSGILAKKNALGLSFLRSLC